MKTFLLFLFIILYCPGLLGQQVVATAGGTLENSYGSISYTIGETVAQTLSKNDKILTQGFHQTNLVVSALIELKDLGYTISAFPNPTTDFVKLKISKEIVNGMQYLLFDLTGRLVSQKKIETNETSVPFQYLQVGSYILKVLDGTKEVKTYKIVKY